MEGDEVAEPMTTCTGDTPVNTYHVTADPLTPGVTGWRYFGTNVDLVIYEHVESFDGKMPNTGAPSLGVEVRSISR